MPTLIPTFAPQAEDAFWQALHDALPPVFTRKVAAQHLGGILSAAGLANLDSKGEGPTVRVQVGKCVGYEKANFISWLRGRKGALGKDKYVGHGKSSFIS